MKKLLFIALAASGFGAFADTQTVVTGDEMGMTAVSTDLKNTIVAVSFTELGESGNVKIENIVNTANLTAGDKVYVINNGVYAGYNLADKDGYFAWEADKNYTVNSSGQLSEANGTPATDQRVEVGTGIWLVKAEKPESAFTFYIYGKIAETASTAAAGAKSLIGNPKMTAATPTITGAATGDQILIPTDGMFKTYKYTSGGWKTVTSGVATTGLPAFPAGKGFWYVSKGSSAVTFAW